MTNADIHITVDPTQINQFRSFCEEMNIKHAEIMLFDSECKELWIDVMTCQTGSFQSIKDIQRAAFVITDVATQHGLRVVRQKIEISPKQFSDYDEHLVQYQEAHIDVRSDVCSPITIDLANKYNAVISKNILKEDTILTIRQFDADIESFKLRVAAMMYDARTVFVKSVHEICIEDTNFTHDADWHNTKGYTFVY